MLNVGAVARAMKNTGLKELALVAPEGSHLHPDARIMAVGGKDILKQALIFEELAGAIADCTWVIGTTRRVRHEREGIIDVRDMASELRDILPQNKVAVVFGPETSGLSNRDLAICQRFVTIPAAPGFGSLNLSQAVMVVCYEIFRATQFHKSDHTGRRLATSGELEGMYEHMEEMLSRVGFLDANNPARMMAVLRRILGRARLNSREVKVIRGICRQVNWATSQVQSIE
jgi:tRNA/rRNA methyltransferase